uniref:Uncharacterized protein n=1 Tax=Arundo donax TaxID=35708 RepID=A0A0A9FX04_ARUDO
MPVVSKVPDLAVPRLAVAAGLAFEGAGAGFFFLGRPSSSSERPQRKMANETTHTETTNMQSPKNHDGPKADAATAPPASAPVARSLGIAGTGDETTLLQKCASLPAPKCPSLPLLHPAPVDCESHTPISTGCFQPALLPFSAKKEKKLKEKGKKR